MRNELLNGKGFILFKGFPVEEWGNHKSAIAYMGLGTYLGYFVSQNGKGHVLGHVKDLGDDAKQIDKVRIYRTNARYVRCLYFPPLVDLLTDSMTANSFMQTTRTSWACSVSRELSKAESPTSLPCTMSILPYEEKDPTC